ncbi:alpha/beta fold hydrolase [Streptomyces hydrogenans]|uniref:alpha/beta fold hydrolase n=1 Tax=Streptomyces hydrogenans TaxID=1873719 RepID=UPI0035E2E597
MDILLIAGLWLDASAWDEVVPELTALGHRPVPVALPGQGDGDASATLEDQVRAVLAAVDAAEGKPLVVGHSAAASLAWLAADALPGEWPGSCWSAASPARTGRRTPTSSPWRTASWPSPAGSPSRARTRPTWTGRPASGSRPAPSPSPRGSPRAWSG